MHIALAHRRCDAVEWMRAIYLDPVQRRHTGTGTESARSSVKTAQRRIMLSCAVIARSAGLAHANTAHNGRSLCNLYVQIFRCNSAGNR